MTVPVPEAPDIPPDVLAELIQFAKDQVAFIEDDIRQGEAREHPPHPQQLENVEGWRFVVLALSELR
jgi:hypothetical protein